MEGSFVRGVGLATLKIESLGHGLGFPRWRFFHHNLRRNVDCGRPVVAGQMVHHPCETHFIGRIHQRVSHTAAVRTTRSAYPVDVIIGHAGHREVDDHFRLGNVNATRADVCAHKHTHFATPELGHGREPGVLGLVGMNLRDLPWQGGLQRLTNALGVFFGSYKHERTGLRM